MARKLILLLLAVLIPGGLIALGVAALAHRPALVRRWKIFWAPRWFWLQTRFRRRLAPAMA